MYLAKDIAYAFVRLGIEEDKPVTQMKLQKLIYFAHGLHLAATQDPLIQEEFQAWKFGPVLPIIYDVYKLYGSEPVTDTFWLELNNADIKIIPLNEKAREAIDATWNTLKDTNAIQLSNWTHRAGSPWAKYYREGVSDIKIPNEDIKAYFEQFVIQNEN